MNKKKALSHEGERGRVQKSERWGQKARGQPPRAHFLLTGLALDFFFLWAERLLRRGATGAGRPMWCPLFEAAFRLFGLSWRLSFFTVMWLGFFARLWLGFFTAMVFLQQSIKKLLSNRRWLQLFGQSGPGPLSEPRCGLSPIGATLIARATDPPPRRRAKAAFGCRERTFRLREGTQTGPSGRTDPPP